MTKLAGMLLFSITSVLAPTAVVARPDARPPSTNYVQYEEDVLYAPGAPMNMRPVARELREERLDPMFRHGSVSWLPELAAEAGWPEETWERLGEIILRESGGCPNRRGGDRVDKDCNITGVAEWNHRSDTGLLQINGVNYNPKRNKWALICREMNICTQAPLLDPVTNLRAGLLLYENAGWGPWDPCNWRKCKKED